ncbi:MAG TPA: hypothetical protein VMS65_11690 [Polyangiaceae bacterium]|nr:hypothetical protein [Polyangiaceae bacterium]
MRKAASSLVFFLLLACGGESKIPDSGKGSAAASGEDASGGSGANHRGGTNAGGQAESGGTNAGGEAQGGNARGGSSAGGTAASGGSRPSEGGEGGEAATSGGTAGTAMAGNAGQGGGTGATAGAGGRNPSDAECDPADGELDATPYPDCEPRDSSDVCELCIQAECCAESKTCYGYYPGNVCGWGGPTTGSYGGYNEIDCYVACVRDYVSEFGVYDDAADTACVPACTTPGCGLIGNATQDLVVCLRAHCDDECFVP